MKIMLVLLKTKINLNLKIKSSFTLSVKRKGRKLETKPPTKIQKDDINGAKEITMMYHFLV